MGELKGNWHDLFGGFKLALDLRKMFLALCGIILTLMTVIVPTCLVVHTSHPQAVDLPESIAPHQIYMTFTKSLDVIYNGCPNARASDNDHRYCPTRDVKERPWFYIGAKARWWVYVPYTIVSGLLLIIVWSLLGGAIARIAAYEVAKGGERMEIRKALSFSSVKFSAFFWAPLICVIGFGFFYLCNAVGGLVGRALDYLYVGSPLIALLLPLALLAGFIMILIVIGTVAGLLLFKPAVAAEGTDSFDAVSRGFSYIFARPWQYLWYQVVNCAYGYVCCAFVILFAVAMCWIALQAGITGFGPNFEKINDVCWTNILGTEHIDPGYGWTPGALRQEPHPYGRVMYAAGQIALPLERLKIESLADDDGSSTTKKTEMHHKIATVIVMFWLLIAIGLSAGYIVSFLISSQTLVYFILRKKVDGIEMNEVYEDEEEADQPFKAETPAPATEAPKA